MKSCKREVCVCVCITYDVCSLAACHPSVRYILLSSPSLPPSISSPLGYFQQAAAALQAPPGSGRSLPPSSSSVLPFHPLFHLQINTAAGYREAEGKHTHTNRLIHTLLTTTAHSRFYCSVCFHIHISNAPYTG